jgi:hypothetical protein
VLKNQTLKEENWKIVTTSITVLGSDKKENNSIIKAKSGLGARQPHRV